MKTAWDVRNMFDISTVNLNQGKTIQKHRLNVDKTKKKDFVN